MILGQHTVAETRDAIRAAEARFNIISRQWENVRKRRAQQPLSPAQVQLDSDVFRYGQRWVDVRDRQTLLLAAAIASNPLVSPIVLPAEVNWTAIQNATIRDEPRLGDIQNRVDLEAVPLGIPVSDQSNLPPQNSPDADFAALHVLDAAIAKGETAAADAKSKIKSIPGTVLGGIPWWGWGIGIGVAGGVGYSFYKTGTQVAEKAKRDTAYIHENLTSKVLPGYKG